MKVKKGLEYTQFIYPTPAPAKKKAVQMKKLYGYMPSVLRQTHPLKGTRFVVVKPKGLKRI